MSIQPQTKFNQIVDRINDLRDRRDLTQFEVARLKQDAKPIKSIDAAEYYTLLGMIASLARNIPEMRENHERAIKLAPHELPALTNYAVSLANAGFFAESLALYEKALEQGQGSLNLIRMSVEASFVAGRFSKCIELLNQLRQLSTHNQEAIGWQPEQLSLFEGVSTFVRERGLTDEMVSPLFDCAISLLHDHDIHWISPATVVLEEDKDVWLSVFNAIDRPASNVADLNFLLAERIADMDFPSEVLQSIVIQYSCSE